MFINSWEERTNTNTQPSVQTELSEIKTGLCKNKNTDATWRMYGPKTSVQFSQVQKPILSRLSADMIGCRLVSASLILVLWNSQFSPVARCLMCWVLNLEKADQEQVYRKLQLQPLNSIFCYTLLIPVGKSDPSHLLMYSEQPFLRPEAWSVAEGSLLLNIPIFFNGGGIGMTWREPV